MTLRTVLLADRRYALQAPEEVLAEVDRIFPLTGGGSGRGATLFTVERRPDGYRIRGGGLPDRRVRRPADAASHLNLAVGELRLAERGARLAVHAGAVAAGERAVLLAGDPEDGKTSCTFHLLEMGCSFVAEEVVSIDSRGRAEPFPQALTLEPELVQESLREFGPLRGGAVAQGDGPLTWYRPHRFARRPVHVGTIVLPSYHPGAAPRCHRRQAADVLVELLGYCFPPLADEEAYFERAMTLAESAAIFQIRYGSAAQARRLLQEILEAAG